MSHGVLFVMDIMDIMDIVNVQWSLHLHFFVGCQQKLWQPSLCHQKHGHRRFAPGLLQTAMWIELADPIGWNHSDQSQLLNLRPKEVPKTHPNMEMQWYDPGW